MQNNRQPVGQGGELKAPGGIPGCPGREDALNIQSKDEPAHDEGSDDGESHLHDRGHDPSAQQGFGQAGDAGKLYDSIHDKLFRQAMPAKTRAEAPAK